tara:strand:+ start:518 stop:1435 length:918 start_codon:yes stop_codon:yes gene_type:complete
VENSKIDPNVGRKNALIASQDNIKNTKKDFLPSIIEFSTSGLCNRKCVFCPRSAPDYNHVNGHLSLENIEKLASELNSYEKDFYFLFSGFSEPLLTKHLEELINIIRKKHKNSTIEINTNTDLLTKKRIKSLFESGLTSIRCSIYDDEKRLKEVGKLLEDSGVEESSYSLRPRYFRKDIDGDKALNNFGINLSNRAGMMENALFSIPTLEEPLKKPCYYPFYNIFVDYNGDYLICPHDWGKGELLGNIENCHIIEDIWLSERANFIREKLLQSRRDVSEACKKCDVPGTFMGLDQAKQWSKLWKT